MNSKLSPVLLTIPITLSLAAAVSVQGAEVGGVPAEGGGVKSYIVVMKQQPAVSYAGGEAQFSPTKPADGAKLDTGKAAVREYRAHLKLVHNESLKAAGASTDPKIHDYSVALNGYSALLTEIQARAVKAQPDVVLVLEDKMRYPDTDSSPRFLGLSTHDAHFKSL